MSQWSANLLLLLAGALWGMGFVSQQVAMDSVGPFTFIAFRFAVASLLVLPFAVRECRIGAGALPSLQGIHWVQFAIIGLCLFGGMATQQIGLLTITVTSSGFLTGLYVVFTPLLSVALLRKWPHRIVWPAALLSFAGIFLLSGGDFSALQKGDFLTIISALFWAIQLVLIAQFVGRSQRPLTLSFVQFAVTSLLAASIAIVTETVNLPKLQGALFEILYSGIFATGIAFSLQVIGQRYTSAPQAAIFLSSESLFAALFGALILSERIGWLGLAGCGLIFSAMLLVELVPELQKNARKTPA